MDKISSQGDAEQYLRDLRLFVPEEVVRQVVNVASGKDKTSFYKLWAGNKSLKVLPICGKGTVNKIKKLFAEGKLEPYLDYLNGDRTEQPANDQALQSRLMAKPPSQELLKDTTEANAQTPVRSLLRVETPGFVYKALGSLFPGYKACSWVLTAHLTNASTTLPIGVRNMKLEVTRGYEVHIVPHLGVSTEGSSGEVPFHEAALPVAVRLKPVETLSGKLRFFERSGFAEGSVRLDLVFEEADGQVHHHNIAESFKISELP